MLTIIPAICTADNRVVDKTSKITYGTPIGCEVYHECSVMNPTFKLSYNASLVGYNYLKVESWSRYYYIMDATVAPGGVIYLTCKEDVLMSNKDDIKNLTAYANRSETSTERYIVDNKVQSKVTNYRTHIPFSGAFAMDGGWHFLLTVKGGKTTPPTGGE